MNKMMTFFASIILNLAYAGAGYKSFGSSYEPHVPEQLR